MKKSLIYSFCIAIVLTGCAEPSVVQATTEPYGFWYGLWHGLIAPISFIASLFNDEIAIYGANNIGGWYDFGFILGVSSAFGQSVRYSTHK
jgi:hypothetical protein